jgi:hypothetical protein
MKSVPAMPNVNQKNSSIIQTLLFKEMVDPIDCAAPWKKENARAAKPVLVTRKEEKMLHTCTCTCI